jgi:hypothetical protein
MAFYINLFANLYTLQLKLSSDKWSIRYGIWPNGNNKILDLARLAPVKFPVYSKGKSPTHEFFGAFVMRRTWNEITAKFYYIRCALLCFVCCLLNHSPWCSASKSLQRGVPVLRKSAQWSGLLQATHQHCPQGNDPPPQKKKSLKKFLAADMVLFPNPVVGNKKQ